MSYLVVENVQGGLDTRKARLAAPAGTLTEAMDGHITEGGEFEKRPAFVALDNPSDADSLVPNTFGLQPTSAGLMVFGSDDLAAADWPDDADGNPVQYQRLQHPAVLAGESYSAGTHAMTAVIHSDVYGDQAFVIAEFADGNRYCYYGGNLVRDFTDGSVLAGRLTLPEVAADFAAIVNRSSSYTAAQLVAPNDDKVNITGPKGVKFETVATEDSASGTISAEKSSEPTSDVAATVAAGSFEIIAGSSSPGTNKITAVKVNGVTITGGAINWTTSNEETARLLALSIQSNVSSPDYTAESNGQVVTIRSKSSSGVTPNGYAVVVEAAGNVCVGNAAFMFTGTQFTVDSINVDGANILTATYPFAAAGTYTTITAALAAIVADINTYNATYLAHYSGPILYISKRTTSSSDAPQNVYITLSNTTVGTGGGVTQVDAHTGGTVAIRATLSITSRTFINNFMHQFLFELAIDGGTPPYTFEGLFNLTTSYFNWRIVSQINATTWQLYGEDLPANYGNPSIYALVKDVLGREATSNTLTLD